MNPEQVLRDERIYLAQNEPTFYQDGSTSYIGKVGRMPTGEEIRIRITFPEFYPIVKPEVQILTPMRHPNLSGDKLDLQMLSYWEPTYRIKDVIFATRRLFVRSKVKSPKKQVMQQGPDPEVERLNKQIAELQGQITAMDKEILSVKQQQLEAQGHTEGLKISPSLQLKSQLQAVDDLLDLIDIKFEEGDLEQTDFFRIYRRYSAERFKLNVKVQAKEGITHELQNKTKTKESIRL